MAVLGILAVGAYFLYSYLTYEESDYDSKGFFICNQDKTICENSQHIHANIVVKSCGKEVLFDKEKGRTDQQHTHKEVNRIHWHARERVNPDTRAPLNIYPRTIKAFFEQMEFKAPQNCGESKATVQVKVNGQDNPQGLDYMWVDNDKLDVEIN